MNKIKPGDRVWVKNPRMLAERKVGTVVASKNTQEGLRYFVEWEVDLAEKRAEKPNGHHPGYLANEIASVRQRHP